MVLSAVAGPVSAGLQASERTGSAVGAEAPASINGGSDATGTSVASIPDDQTVTDSSGLGVWKQAPFPLRTETDTNNVATKLDLPREAYVETESALFDLNKDRAVVYENDSEITVNFSEDRARHGGALTGEDTQFVVARLEKDVEIPERAEEIPSLLTGNPNVQAEVVAQKTVSSTYGTDFTYQPSSSGVYVFGVAVIEDDGDGLVDGGDGNLTVASPATIAGVDVAFVQEGSSSVTPPQAIPRGGNVTFGVSAEGLNDSNVDHTVIVVNETALRNHSERLDLTTSPATVESSVLGTRGAARTEDGANVFGAELDDADHRGTTDLRSVIARFAGDDADVEYTDDADTLDASITSTNGAPTDSVTVGTDEQWDTGTYRWIHIATDDDSTRSATSGGTVEVKPGVELELTANRTTVPRGLPVRFTVTRTDGTPVQNAAVAIDGTDGQTDANGEVVLEPTKSGTATASKAPDADSAYIEDSVDVTVEEPNVAVTDFSVSDSKLTRADNLTVTATIRNQDPIRQQIDVSLSVNGTATETRTVSAPAASSTTTTFELSFDTKGDKRIDVNDLGEQTVTVTGVPNIAYENIDYSRHTLDPDMASYPNLTVTATVTNNGDGSGAYNASLVVDGADVEWQNGTLEPGQSADVTFTRAMSSGPHDVRIRGLRDDPFPDQNIDVLAPANLAVRTFELNRTDGVLGDDVRVTVEVENTGDEDASWALIHEGKVLTSQPLGGNESVTHVETIVDPAKGVHEVSLVDQETTFEIRAPDLTSSVSAPSEVTSGTVRVDGLVTNRGNAAAANAEVELQTRPVGGSDWTTVDSATATLGPGDDVALSGTLTRDEARNYTVRTVADGSDSIRESRENNNEAATTVTGNPLVRGTVEHPSGQGVADAVVFSYLREQPLSGPRSYADETDSTGSYLTPTRYNHEADVRFAQVVSGSVEAGETRFVRDGTPDLYALGRVDGTESEDGVLNFGTETLPESGVVTVTVRDQSGDPVENANVTLVHRNNGSEAVFTTYTDAQGQIALGEDDQRGIELAGDVTVLVEPPTGEARFLSRTYSRQRTVGAADESFDVRLAEGPDLTVSVDAADRQRVQDGVTADLTVANDGLQDAKDVRVRVTAVGTSADAKWSKLLGPYNLEARGGDNETTESVDLTAFATDNLVPGSLKEGNVRLTAEVDPNDEIDSETDESNNVGVNRTTVTYSDLGARVVLPDSVIADKNTTALVYVSNNGTATSDPASVEVAVPKQNNVTRSVRALSPGEQRTYSVSAKFSGSGTQTAVTTVLGDSTFPENNRSTDDVDVTPFTLDFEDDSVDAPTEVINGDTVYVTATYGASHAEEIAASIDLSGGDGIELTQAEQQTKTQTPSSTGDNRVSWELRANSDTDRNDVPITVDLAATDSDLSTRASGTATTDVVVSKTRVENATAVRRTAPDTVEVSVDGSGNPALTVVGNNTAQVYEHELNVTVQAGTDGRTLTGLQYLFHYPWGCVEQTTSQMVTALRVDEYYRGEDNEDWSDRDRANDTIRQGANKLSGAQTRVSHWYDISQEDNGAWSMWGRDESGDLFYTMYAFQGTSAVANDPVQSQRTHVSSNLSEVDYDGAVEWLRDKQDDDGYMPVSGYFLEDRASTTGYVLVAMNRSEDRLSPESGETVEEFRIDAAEYLIASQNGDGSWAAGSKKPQATAIAVLGLQTVKDAGLENQVDGDVDAAIDAGVAYLSGSQQADGSWTGYHQSIWWPNRGEKAQATGFAVLALHEVTGATYMEQPGGNATVDDGTDYLVEVYEQGGSFGNTRATAVAVNALTAVGQRADDQRTVTVSINASNGNEVARKEVEVGPDTDLSKTVTFDYHQLEELRERDGYVTVRTHDDGLVVVGLDSAQTVNEREYSEA